MTDLPPSTSPNRRGAAGFVAENLLLLGILFVLLGLFFGSCVLWYGFHWLLAAAPFATGIFLVGLAWRVRRKSLPRNLEPGDGSND